MGGKHKVANRTKNNARPSNSGRSAELLGKSISPLAGFSGFKDSTFGLSLSNTDELDSTLDPHVQVILKKIQKKDSTTKIKGLQEFAVFVKDSDQEVVKTVLPVWPRFYNVLATDVDNRVREATHNVHHQIILKVKRNIAPYLKQLMAPWFTSQYDTYPPAASAATRAFKDAFPPNKIQEAIVFCQEEILNYLSDNLLVQTVQTLSNIKNLSSEEAEAKYERVLISCLQGYCLYLEKVSTEEIKNAAELNNSIISNAKFWKFSKSKVAYVRASFFKIISVVCQKAVFLFDDKGSHVVGSVFGVLEEYDPTVLPQVWEAALLTMSSIQEWWKFVNIDKVFLPKLWKILKNGGQGNAVVIYPSLLPLVSHLPPTVDDTGSQFYSLFFENLWIGFSQKSTISSRTESVAVATAFIECLQYIILKKQSDVIFCKTLIKNHLITSIEWCLLETQTNYKSLFNQTSSLIQHWSRNLDSETLKACFEFFLENIRDLFRDTLYNVKERANHDMPKVAEKQLDFLQSLKSTSNSKKQFKVKFCTETDRTVETKSDQSINVIDNKIYHQRLNGLVYNICEDYVQYISEKRSNLLIEHLYSLIIDFDTKSFFANFDEKMKAKKPDSQLIDIYTNVLYSWLTTPELCCKNVISLIFLLFEYVQVEDKKMILDTLLKVPSEECLSWCISEALSHPYSKDELVQVWLRSERISRFIVSITDKIISDECPPDLGTLFKLALTENEHGELVTNKNAVSDIISKLLSTIQDHPNNLITADTCSSLAAYISALVYTEHLLLTYNDTLLLVLFRLSCNPAIDNEVISKETMYEVTTAWQDALTLLSKYISKEDSLNLTKKMAQIIEEQFLTNHLEESNTNHFITVVVNALTAIYKSLPLDLTEYLNIFVERDFLHSIQGYTQELCILAEYMTGSLSSPYKEIKTIQRTADNIDVARYVAWTYFKLGIISSTLKDVVPEYEDDEDDDEDESQQENTESEKLIKILSVIDDADLFVVQILHDICVQESYLSTFKNTLYYDVITHYFVLSEMNLKSTVINWNKLDKPRFKKLLRNNCLEHGWHWAKAVYRFYSEIIPENLPAIYLDFVKDISETNKENILHLTEVFSSHLNYDYIQNKFDTVGDIIVLKSLIHCDEIDVQIAEVFNKLKKFREQYFDQLLYTLSNISWKDSQQIIETIRLFTSMMKFKFNSLSQEHWTIAVLSLVPLVSSCVKSTYEKYQFQALLSSVVQLFVELENQIKLAKEQEISTNYVDEWGDLFVQDVHNDLLQIWFSLADQLRKKETITTYLPFMGEFSKVLAGINCSRIFKASDAVPKWSNLLKQSCLLLVNRQANLQLWGYKMLLILVPGLVKIDSEAVNTNTPHKKGLIFEQFKEKLVETHDIVDSMLGGFKLGEDTCRVEPLTDSFTYTFAYLLLWDVLLTLCDNSSTELRFQYADWLRNENLLKLFLNNIFKLMPAEILHYGEGKSKSIKEPFLRKPELNINATCNSETIERMVCWLYSSTLTQLPAVVRQWWTGLDSKFSQVVEKVTQIYVSPNLILQELNDLMTYQSKFKNMVLKVLPGAREIIAIYTVDEAQVELLITLPPNYPLGSLEVECNKQIAGTSDKQWLLQFKKCVVHQNGRIWDGLSIWNNNLDKKFDGVEECYICFAVLHPGTYQLPKLSCQTCKKKFHSACLYKWFRTSYKSSCPICRNLF